MKTVRLALSTLILLFLGGGFAANQWAAMNGTIPEYMRQVDQPAVRALAAVIMLGAFLLAFVPPEEDEAA